MTVVAGKRSDAALRSRMTDSSLSLGYVAQATRRAGRQIDGILNH